MGILNLFSEIYKQYMRTFAIHGYVAFKAKKLVGLYFWYFWNCSHKLVNSWLSLKYQCGSWKYSFMTYLIAYV